MKTLSVCLLALAAVALIAGCSTITRQTHFTPCVNPQCLKCRGTGSYKCAVCLGRGQTVCRGCHGAGHIKCFDCGGDGVRANGVKCACALGLGPVGRKLCAVCNGTGHDRCNTCRGKGMIDCGTTTYDWLCRKCGERFDYPAKVCPKCGAE